MLGKETRGLLDKEPRSDQRAQTHWINRWVPEVELAGRSLRANPFGHHSEVQIVSVTVSPAGPVTGGV